MLLSWVKHNTSPFKVLLFDKDLKIEIYYNIQSFMVNTTTNVVLKFHLMINITTLVVHLASITEFCNTSERVLHTEAIGPRLTTGNLSFPPLRTWSWVDKSVVPTKVYTPAKLTYYVGITYYKIQEL